MRLLLQLMTDVPVPIPSVIRNLDRLVIRDILYLYMYADDDYSLFSML